MKDFDRLKAVAAPLMLENVDTDQILPARFLSLRPEDGYQDYCFRDQRFDQDGNFRPEFLLNRDEYAHAQILVAGANFGCGSSREGAVYALMDMGIRSVIAEGFGDIFAQNAMVNGLLPVAAPRHCIERLDKELNASRDKTIEIDLENQTVSASADFVFRFEIDPFRKLCLLHGTDEIDFTMRYLDKIRGYEEKMARDLDEWKNLEPC